MTKKTKKRVLQVRHERPLVLQTTVPQWIADMHQHFRETGTFRAEDVKRVLGDPRDSVEIRLETGLGPLGGHASKK